MESARPAPSAPPAIDPAVAAMVAAGALSTMAAVGTAGAASGEGKAGEEKEKDLPSGRDILVAAYGAAKTLRKYDKDYEVTATIGRGLVKAVKTVRGCCAPRAAGCGAGAR